METIGKMLLSVAAALVVFGLLFVGLNVLLDSARRRWWVLPSAGLGIVGLVVGAALQHNEVFPSGIWGILLGGAIGVVLGAAVGVTRTPDPSAASTIISKLRPVLFVGPALLFVTAGLVVPAISTTIISLRSGRRGDGAFTLQNYEDIFADPRDRYFSLEGWPNIFTSRLFIVAVGAVVLAGLLAWASTRRLAGGGAARSAVRLSRGVGISVGVVLTLMLIGLIEGVARSPNESTIFDVLTVVVSSRASLAIVLALLGGGSIWLLASRRDQMSGLVRQRSDWVVPGVAGIVSAAGVLLAILGEGTTREVLTLVGIGVAIVVLWAVWRLRAEGGSAALDFGTPGSSLALLFAAILLALAVFSTLQGVIWNNLWWVAAVAGLSTVLGLLLAILADRSPRETLAKTMIFLPMAISMVGAAVIWNFVYERQVTGNQTGILNAVLTQLGFEPRGFFINSSMIPWNNFFIMIIMIWIQTGFAMVVISAAIKGVPTELVEAARVDGASEVQVFWRVIIPQIMSTILVVVTTLVIVVMKVFDLVKATTNGANGTDVLANEMFNKLRDGNFAFSSAFAVVIFGLALPIMVYNVRRTKRELSA